MEDAVIKGLFGEGLSLLSVLDGLPFSVLVVTPERRLRLINQASNILTGEDLDRGRDLPCRYILRANFCFQNCPVLEWEEGEEGSITREGNIINKDRQKVPIRLHCAPLKDAQGKLMGFIESVEDLRFYKDNLNGSYTPLKFSHFIARSPQMERVFQILPGIAQTDSSVLITGETGTGKDLLAEAIHQTSARAKGPFVKVNCGALPETLLESELFGHEKGAFTGATHTKPGRFRLAHNGTLFLTEIGDLPLALQVKLLTFLDDRVIYPLGSTKGINVDVRVIAATHRNLRQMVQEGKFREDLYYRLNVVRIHIPPLRERGEDIKLLLDHFLKTFAAGFNKSIQGFSQESLNILLSYGYPGNVRELRNIVEYTVNVCNDKIIETHHLPSYLTDKEHTDAVGFVPVSFPEECRNEEGKDEVSPSGSTPKSFNWSEIEKNMIIEALIRSKGRRSKAAKMLGWGRSTLWRKMKEYNITP